MTVSSAAAASSPATLQAAQQSQFLKSFQSLAQALHGLLRGHAGSEGQWFKYMKAKILGRPSQTREACLAADGAP